MRWYPVVTFWQVSADLTNAEGMPAVMATTMATPSSTAGWR
ncbi:hypothetical protein I553_5264 [Mycobacterium xenopi 4042]|uniref:Alpha/beta-hydrolase catalytic domain-containing protein n=1 Tax=Mycobacterium xenopi 4042 TaxID=1299334 RepID=X7ZXY2_MYCXE|nr:hypothetical protein I553_5264 [Mycobacterium xenopi 4042]